MTFLVCIIIFIFGTVLGSFFACLGYRVPNKISMISPGSFCPNCKKELKPIMLIPIISYLIQKGKCAYCKKKISIMYPLIEFLTGTVFVINYLYFGFSENFFLSIIISSALLITCITDFRYLYVSDRVIVCSLIFITIIKVYFNGLVGLKCLIASLGVFLVMLLIKIIGDKIFKQESLGGGDVKLMSIVGAAVGFVPGVFCIIIASILALPVSLIILGKNKEEIVPFGPFLLFAPLLMLYIFPYFEIYLKWLGI